MSGMANPPPVRPGRSVLGAASLTALLASATQANAQVAYFTTPVVPNHWNTMTGETVNWDVDGNGSTDFSLFAAYSTVGPFVSQWFFVQGSNRFIASGTKLLALASGATVSAGGNFGFSGGSITANGFPVTGRTSGFDQNGSNFIGFRFDLGGSSFAYGWAELTFRTNPASSANPGGGFAIERWAYNTTGGSINVGAVPEPAAAATGLGLLALGAAGLHRQRWLKRNRG